MTTVYRYRIYCITQGAWETKWAITPITTCPINSEHTVNANSVNDVAERTFSFVDTISSLAPSL